MKLHVSLYISVSIDFQQRCQCRKDSLQQMMLGKLDMHVQKQESPPLSYITY